MIDEYWVRGGRRYRSGTDGDGAVGAACTGKPDAHSHDALWMIHWCSSSTSRQLSLLQLGSATFSLHILKTIFYFYTSVIVSERVCVWVCVDSIHECNVFSFFTVRWPRSPPWINSSVPVFVTCKRQDTPVVLSLKPLLPLLDVCVCVCVFLCVCVWVCKRAFTAICALWTLRPKCLEHSDCRGDNSKIKMIEDEIKNILYKCIKWKCTLF